MDQTAIVLGRSICSKCFSDVNTSLGTATTDFNASAQTIVGNSYIETAPGVYHVVSYRRPTQGQLNFGKPKRQKPATVVRFSDTDEP